LEREITAFILGEIWEISICEAMDTKYNTVKTKWHYSISECTYLS